MLRIGNPNSRVKLCISAGLFFIPFFITSSTKPFKPMSYADFPSALLAGYDFSVGHYFT